MAEGFEAFAQLLGNRLQSGSLFGSGLHIVIDGQAAVHGFTADRHQGVVYLFGELLQSQVYLGHGGGELVVTGEFVHVKTGRQDVGVGLGSGQAIADKGETFVAHFEKFAAFFSGEMNQERQFGFDRAQGSFDFVKIGGRELGGDVLVGRVLDVLLRSKS